MEFIHTVAGLVILTFLSLSNSLPTIMKLERAIPMGSSIKDLQSRDEARHGRTRTGVVNFPLESSSGPYKSGCYITKLKIGSPPREFRLMIDTGSQISWVNCIGCDGCLTSSISGMQLQFYNPNSSSSASTIGCSDKRCAVDSIGQCNSQHPRCFYLIKYVDSVTAGHLISDVFHLPTIMAGSTTHFSTSVLFGCNEVQTDSDTAYDGILGLNPARLSLISQLSSPVFSVCLSGGEGGGGVLVLGQILEPSIVYIPLDISQNAYNVNLQSIAVNGNNVQIDPAVFESNKGGATLVDSGTTLAVLSENAYDPVISSLTAAVSHHAQPITIETHQCFTTSSRIHDIFPLVSFNFEGGKSMIVKPKDYLIRLNENETETWCIGFRKIAGESRTILGDIVLRDKIIIYDLARKRLGWANYDCSQPMKVSSRNLSSSNSPLTTAVTTMLSLFVYFFMFG